MNGKSVDQLAGKVAVVTGAAGGIGLAIATRFAEEGMRVVLADLDGEELAASCRGLREKGFDAISVQVDVSEAAQVEALAAKALDAFGAVDVVCNNAGVNAYGFKAWEASDATWEWVFGVNVRGVVNGVRTFVPLFLEAGSGHVVNVASGSALRALPLSGVYAASKHAVLGFSEALRQDLEGTGVGVSVVCPGATASRIRASSRLWPERLGSNSAVGAHQRPVDVDPNLRVDPAVVADHTLEAVRANRFLVAVDLDVARAALTNRLQMVEEGVGPLTWTSAGSP